jgi:hypothetical protein
LPSNGGARQDREMLSRLRTSALLVAATLAGAGLPMLAGVAPADAVSGTLSYDCTSSPSTGSSVFTAVIDTDAPASLGTGLTTPIQTTATVTVPSTIVDGLHLLGAATVSGTGDATGTVDGVARHTSLTITRTPVPPGSTTMQLAGHGPSGAITAGAVGSTILLGAGDFTASIQGYDTAGSAVGPTYAFTCTLQPSQDLLVDTVSVVRDPTTVALTVAPAPVEYGAAPTVSADVSQTGSNAKPAGTIAFSYAGKTVTADVKGGKAKATLPAALTIGAQSVSAVFTPTDPNLAPSSSTKAFTVVKGSTTTTATATYRAALHRLVGKGAVVATQGTDVAGTVKLILKRKGTKIRSAKVELNAKDKAKWVFRHIGKPGKYTLVARYLGSSTLKRSTGRTTLTI